MLLFVHAFDYMVELIRSYRLVHYSYIAISNRFELNTCFLTFYCNPYFLSQIHDIYTSVSYYLYGDIFFSLLLKPIFPHEMSFYKNPITYCNAAMYCNPLKHNTYVIHHWPILFHHYWVARYALKVCHIIITYGYNTDQQ